MRYIATVDSDVGIAKETNQDSALIKHAKFDNKEVLLTILCDGMGGLSKGELASATVIREFDKWFDEELPYELENPDLKVIGGKWELMLKDLNTKILEYGKTIGSNLGTTFTGMLFIDNDYLIVQVGDSRAYYLSSNIEQLTEDQTVVAREVKLGNITKEQAKVDKRRNMLLQCVGASRVVVPDIILGSAKNGVYMLCSDGFRHEITESEIYESLNKANLLNKESMHANTKYLIDLNKTRNERDNITVILIKAED